MWCLNLGNMLTYESLLESGYTYTKQIGSGRSCKTDEVSDERGRGQK